MDLLIGATECAADDNADLAIPDYRVVTARGSHHLIEVKNFHKTFDKPFTVGSSLMDQWCKYAKLTGASFKIAVYFSRYKHWMLLSPESFSLSGKRYSIHFAEAMKSNEMIILGDAMVGTRCPLSIRIRFAKLESAMTQKGGTASGRVVDVKYYCQAQHIAEKAEQRIASLLIVHGGWSEEVRVEFEDEMHFTMIYEFKPEEEAQGQDFQLCDFFSRIFSRYYIAVTSDVGPERRELSQIYSNKKPIHFNRLIPRGFKGKDLPIWMFFIRPGWDVGNEAVPDLVT